MITIAVPELLAAKINPRLRGSAAVENATDAELVTAIARGEVRAFSVLVERHRAAVMRLAFSITRNRAEAEEIVQDAFERVWTRAGSWTERKGASVFAWLARITVNRAIDLIRRAREIGWDEPPEVASGEPDAEALMFSREIGRRIGKALETLPERQRLAFALCQIERLSNAQAASTLGVTVGALELLLVRARKRMREQLADLREALA